MRRVSVRRAYHITDRGIRADHYGVMVRFKKRNGGSFYKTFSSRHKAARAVRAWRAKGGRVLKIY